MENVQDDLTSISDTKELLREQTRALRALLKIAQERDEREKTRPDLARIVRNALAQIVGEYDKLTKR